MVTQGTSCALVYTSLRSFDQELLQLRGLDLFQMGLLEFAPVVSQFMPQTVFTVPRCRFCGLACEINPEGTGIRLNKLSRQLHF